MPLLSREATGLPIVIWYSSAKGGHGARIKCSSKLGDVFRENGKPIFDIFDILMSIKL
jgi:hypothetical protein